MTGPSDEELAREEEEDALPRTRRLPCLPKEKGLGADVSDQELLDLVGEGASAKEIAQRHALPMAMVTVRLRRAMKRTTLKRPQKEDDKMPQGDWESAGSACIYERREGDGWLIRLQIKGSSKRLELGAGYVLDEVERIRELFREWAKEGKRAKDFTPPEPESATPTPTLEESSVSVEDLEVTGEVELQDPDLDELHARIQRDAETIEELKRKVAALEDKSTRATRDELAALQAHEKEKASWRSEKAALEKRVDGALEHNGHLAAELDDQRAEKAALEREVEELLERASEPAANTDAPESRERYLRMLLRDAWRTMCLLEMKGGEAFTTSAPLELHRFMRLAERELEHKDLLIVAPLEEVGS